MSFLYDEPITDFFHRISSKDKPKKLRKRKRLQEDTEANRSLTPSDKKPKIQQKLFFSNDGQTTKSAGPSGQVAKIPSLKRGESSKSLVRGPAATPSPVDASSRVSSKETPITRYINTLPTPLTAKRPALAQMTRSYLVSCTDQSTRTPRPDASQSSIESSLLEPRKTINLPTPVTMPRSTIYSRAQKSPQSRVRSLSPSRQLSSPQISSVYPLSAEYKVSVTLEEGQRNEYSSDDESSSPPLSQKLVPSSQSQADGCFDSTSLFPENPGPSRSRHSPVFLVPRIPNKITTGLLHIVDDEDRSQTLCSKEQKLYSEPSLPVVDSPETSLIEIHDGEEYVLSSQSQLVLPFHVSPRKNRRKVSCSSSSSMSEHMTHSDEIVPSSQSQLEEELDAMDHFTDDRRHALPVIDGNSLTAESSSQTHLVTEPTAAFSFSEGSPTSTQILVEETPEGYYELPLKDDEPGSVTEEDEGDDMFSPDPANSAWTDLQEFTSSPSQESTTYPSSLPDAIKEFREMFGDGDGSYPDDFPMSLRD